jgi:hypothetical protein
MPERNHKHKHIAGKTQLRTLCVDDLLLSYLLYSRHAMLNQEPCNHRLVELLLTQTYAQQTAKTTSQTTAAHLVCRRLAAVVSVVQATCDVEPGAVHAGHPQAAAAAAAASAVATAKIAWGRQTPTPTKQLYTLCVDDLLPSYLLCSRHAMLNQEQCTHTLLLTLLVTRTKAPKNRKHIQHKKEAVETQLRTLCVDDLLPSYLLCRRHAMLNQEQWMLGTHRLLLPVSKMT